VWIDSRYIVDIVLQLSYQENLWIHSSSIKCFKKINFWTDW